MVKIIESSKIKKNYKIHSATKVFQALRIFVNKEISELIYGLINAAKVLDEGGIIVIVSFHSLEDKIIKYFFKSLSETKSVSIYIPQENYHLYTKYLIPLIFQRNPTVSYTISLSLFRNFIKMSCLVSIVFHIQ